MKSVFISHSSKDKAIADVIVASLEQEGISVSPVAHVERV